MLRFAQSVKEWLNADPENVIVVHCKGNLKIELYLLISFRHHGIPWNTKGAAGNPISFFVLLS